MAAEYSGLRQTCEILTILGWQCVLLFSLGRLQFGLVEAENFCDVWFVAHVCRCSEKQTKRLDTVFPCGHLLKKSELSLNLDQFHAEVTSFCMGGLGTH